MADAPGSPTVLIVGAGPAGCAAAIALGRLGHAAVLLDRAVFPRDKVCGDVLLPSTLQELVRLGLDPGELLGEAVICPGIRYVSPSGRVLEGDFAAPASPRSHWLVVRRRFFDAWLLGHARRAGAQIRERTTVSGVVADRDGTVRGVRLRGGGEADRGGGDGSDVLEGDVVIGADGAGSAVARDVGCRGEDPSRIAVAVRGYAEGGELHGERAEVFTTARALPGCCWLVPTGAGVWNVGAGMIKADAIRRGVNPGRLLEEMRQTVPSFGARLGSARLRELRGGTLPLPLGGGPVGGRGWLLAGDAARLIDPLTGHGIHTALLSGRLAAEAVCRAETPDALRAGRHGPEYARNLRRHLAREARGGELIRRLHSRPSFAEAIAWSGARSAPLRAILLALMGHVAPRAEVLRLAALLRLAWRRA